MGFGIRRWIRGCMKLLWRVSMFVEGKRDGRLKLKMVQGMRGGRCRMYMIGDIEI